MASKVVKISNFKLQIKNKSQAPIIIDQNCFGISKLMVS